MHAQISFCEQLLFHTSSFFYKHISKSSHKLQSNIKIIEANRNFSLNGELQTIRKCSNIISSQYNLFYMIKKKKKKRTSSICNYCTQLHQKNNIEGIFWPKYRTKGDYTYSITPRDHKSAVWLQGCSRTSSGAIYRGVPVEKKKQDYY